MAACILLLGEDGALDLDDRLETFLPGTGVPYADVIALRQLLDHRSGVYNYTENPAFWEYITTYAGPYPPSTLLGFATSQTPYHEPGAAGEWTYSNTNYLLAGMIMEDTTGLGLDQVLDTVLLTPLGLDDTWSAGLEPTPPSNVVEYMYDGSPAIDAHWTWAFGAGHILQSARDQVTFVDALFRGSVLEPASIETMTTPDPGYIYGLEIFVYPVDDWGVEGDLYEHAGATIGTTSLQYHHPRSGVSVVGRINSREFDGMEDHPILVVRTAMLLAIESLRVPDIVTWELY